MRKMYYLSTCSTCKRIMQELGDRLEGFEKQDIKAQSVSLDQVDQMKSMSGSYESLFSRRSMKYKSMGLAQKNLSEDDFRQLINEEYTFLKRPVFIVDEKIFDGNSQKVVDELKSLLDS